MAIGIRATGANGDFNDASTGFTVTLSGAPVAGDLIIAAFTQNPHTSGGYQTPGVPFSMSAVSGGSVQKSDWKQLKLFSKIASGSEGTSAAFTYTTNTLDCACAGIIVLSGVNTSTPLGTPVTQDDASSNTTVTIPALTTTAANSYAVAFAALGAASGAGNTAAALFSAWPNSMTEAVDFAEFPNEWCEIGIAYVAVPSITTLTSGTVTSAVADTGLSIIVEVKEIGGGGGGGVMRPSSGIGNGGMSDMNGGMQGRAHGRGRIVVPPAYLIPALTRGRAAPQSLRV